MREEDIRPARLLDESAGLFVEDLARVMKGKPAFELVPCPACEASDYQLEFAKDGFDFVRCASCCTLFVNPRPSSEMLAEYYATSKRLAYWNDRIFPATEAVRRGAIFAPRAAQVVELARRHRAADDLLVDVGAGFGTFCEEVMRLGAFQRVVAIEPSAELAETCRRKGVEVVEAPIEHAEIGAASVITNFELIEHLSRPRDFVAACAGALGASGLLILTTPNVMGFDLRTLGRLSDNVVGPNHLNYFTPGSLTSLIERSGLQVVDVATPGQLDAELVRKQVLAGTLDLEGQPFLQTVLIDEWDRLGAAFQRFLAEHRLSSHLWIVAKKLSRSREP